MPLPPMTASDQVKVLQSLSQGATAWLLGVSPRALRDRPTLPRNPDGTYDAQQVLGWAVEQERESCHALMAAASERLEVLCDLSGA